MTFLVAELGVNWDGNFELLDKMMDSSKKVGFNAIKLQCFDQNNVKNHLQSTRLMNTTVTKDNIQRIDQIAKKNSIEWFCTPMYPEAVDLLNPYVKKFKVRMNDSIPMLNNQTTKLLDKILDTKKEVIISSEQSMENSIFYNNPKLIWLYGIPKYPCEITELNFKKLDKFDGYSNHCQDPLAIYVARSLGAKYFEIHVTMDKSKDYIDNVVSFDFNETKLIIENIKKIKFLLNNRRDE